MINLEIVGKSIMGMQNEVYRLLQLNGRGSDGFREKEKKEGAWNPASL